MSRSAGGTIYLIFIQVASRGLTFIGNQVLLRYLSPTLLGIAVQLELVSVTILYFARESLRTALQRQPIAKESDKKGVQHQSQATVNLSYLAVGLGLIIASICASWYLRVADLEVLHSPHFNEAFYIYAAATLLELCAEPYFVVIQQHSLYKERARAETSGAIARCFFACATAFITTRQGLPPSVLPFALGQLAYSIQLFLLYLQAAYRTSRQQNFHLFPQPIVSQSSDYLLSLFSKQILSLATTMYIQSIFKLLLTEGDHVILSFLSSLADQGAFALASNYGGLLARLIFQPIEESSRNIFGRLLATSPSPVTAKSPLSPNIQSPSPSNKETNSNTTIALSHISSTLKAYTALSLPLLSLGPPLLPYLTPLILSTQWRNPSTTILLQTYIYYIPFLAVNGILDAFVTSVATPAQLSLQSIAMVLITIVYGGACFAFLRGMSWGSAGLVGAGMVNMSCRIAFGCWFLRRWIRAHAVAMPGGKRGKVGFWRGCVPTAQSTITAVGVGLWLNSPYGLTTTTTVDNQASRPMSQKNRLISGIDLDVMDLGKFIAGAMVVGGTLVFYEGNFLLSILHNVVPEKHTQRIPFLRASASEDETIQQNRDTDERKKEL